MGKARLVAFLLVISASAGAPAQLPEPDWAMADTLEAAVSACPPAQMPPGERASARGMHVPDPSAYVHRQLELMLHADPANCPGVAEDAASRLRVLVGAPERADVPIGLLGLLHQAAEEGLGMERDPGLADRLGRILWLLAWQEPDIPRWSEADRRAWLVQPDTLALLQAHVAYFNGPTRQAVMLAELRLRSDLSLYDPREAARLFERAMEFERFADLLSDGEHLPPDYRAAVAPILRLGMFTSDKDDQRALVRVGRRAAAAARTREERGQALRILFAGAVEDVEGSCALVAEQLRPFRGVPVVPLEAGAGERILDELANDFDPFLVSDDPPVPRPIVLRALIDPSGRVIYARVRQSSGSRDRDRFPIEAWAASAEAVDLSATSRGRFVWADLPPIPPEPTTTLDAPDAPNPPDPC